MCKTLHTCGTAVTPNISLSTAIQRATITSSLTPSIMEAASPATRARSTGTCKLLLVSNRLQIQTNRNLVLYNRECATALTTLGTSVAQFVYPKSQFDTL